MSLIERKDPDLDVVINQLVEIVRPIVLEIEKRTPTSQNYYGEYITAIATIADMLAKNSGESANTQVYLSIGIALQRAGANKQGVLSALKAMGHL